MKVGESCNSPSGQQGAGLIIGRSHECFHNDPNFLSFYGFIHSFSVFLHADVSASSAIELGASHPDVFHLDVSNGPR